MEEHEVMAENNVERKRLNAEYADYLERAKKDSIAHKEALEKNPEGGCFYLPHPIQVHSGQFWRCKHGNNAFWIHNCFSCMLRHPILAWRWHFSKKNKE